MRWTKEIREHANAHPIIHMHFHQRTWLSHQVCFAAASDYLCLQGIVPVACLSSFFCSQM